MGEEDTFPKGFFSAGDLGAEGDPREIGESFLIFFAKGEGDETGTALRHLEIELAGDPLAEIRGTQVSERETAGCDDKGVGSEWSPVALDEEISVPMDGLCTAIQEDFNARFFAFLKKKACDLFGGGFAEKLAQLLLVIFDLVFLHQTNEILRCEPGQGRFAKVFIGGEEVLRV